jgi:hypothetical protein
LQTSSMGCAGSHAGSTAALAEDLPTCENPLVASCVADEELTVVLIEVCE